MPNESNRGLAIFHDILLALEALSIPYAIIDAKRGEKVDLFPLTMDLRYQPAFDNRVRRLVSLPDIEPFSV